MPIDVDCPSCGEFVTVDSEFLGAESTCPRCHLRFVPAPDFAPAVPDISLPAAPHPGFWWSVLWCFGLILFLNLVPGILGVIILIAKEGPHALANPEGLAQSRAFGDAMLPAMIVTQTLSAVLALFVLRLIVGRNWARRVALRLPSWQHVALVLLGLPGLIVVAVGVDGLARRVLPGFGSLDQAMDMFEHWNLPLAVLAVGLGPGIAEELWFRAFMGRGLVGRFGVVGGVLLTSMFFGIVHVEPHHAVSAGTLGIFLHLSYLATRSLLIPIMLHVVNNSLSMIALHWEPLRFANVDASDIPWFVYAAAVTLLAGIGWALFASRPRFDDGASGSPWRPDFPGVEFPPASSGTRIVRPGPSLFAWAVALLAVALFAGATVPAALAYNARNPVPELLHERAEW